ncbi:CYTH domain-containing protein [Methylobacterium sp. DB0501]|jgi:adenylate cyclase|uniref:CYTH domain-containing protein n=1 Tax=Methylobacterium sp. DB0501 TaxID=2709665 RepID=UPI0013EC2A3F|nr:CYTH domain-containing protein [Methylobacterium sp. DB0501]NGM38507.1 CYTH domain-containing protein [Methylobacterium sp. DB0501]
MRIEIERRFLVAHDGWRARAAASHYLRDGFIGQFSGGKVRVRLDAERAWLTVKGARIGLGRPEFEYEIPQADAEAMVSAMCQGCLIEKTRYCIPHAGLTWVVDVYEGDLAGMILAEVELEHEDQVFALPDWAGLEVSGDVRFRQTTLLRLRAELGRPLTPALVLGLSIPLIDSLQEQQAR